MNVKRKSQKQEKDVANHFNAKTVIASGAFWSAKGDVRSDKFLIECKFTDRKSYVVTSKVWEKISKEAVKDHLRIPLLIVDIRGTRIVIFNPHDFEDDVTLPVYHKDIPKSFTLYPALLGYNEFGDYISSIYRFICGEQLNVLKCMCYEDFEREVLK